MEQTAHSPTWLKLLKLALALSLITAIVLGIRHLEKMRTESAESARAITSEALRSGAQRTLPDQPETPEHD